MGNCDGKKADGGGGGDEGFTDAVGDEGRTDQVAKGATSSSGGGGGRPGSPPRDLSAILKSPVLTNDFRSFLADLDEEAGDADDRLRVTWLNFVLACRELHDEPSTKERRDRMKKMHRDFFSETRVSLKSRAAWNACQKLCKEGRATGDLTALWTAHDHAMSQLDDLHQPFLLQSHAANRTSLPDVIQQCLL